MSSVVTWSVESPVQLGRAVIAIGVFDGVHLGHQDLIRRASDEARRRTARCVAVTFDRDPDQVISPETAAPQLLSLEDKVEALGAHGADVVLVVPFDETIASTPATEFLEEVLGSCCEVVAIHVGADFRFGRGAEGDIETLYAWVAEHGGDVRPHDLLSVDGTPVTSTRIRRLVADGAVAGARALLGRPHRVVGTVVQGRREGTDLGFPTANLEPMAFAAVPADGVYAGWAVLPDGRPLAAAISLGVPPTFPEAEAVIEAHLLDFDGDLYGQPVALDFIEHVRAQRAFGSREELSAAIAHDVRMVRSILGGAGKGGAAGEEGPDMALVDDPLALEAAEHAVAAIDPQAVYETEEEWVELVPPRRLSGLFGDAGFTAAVVTAPLQSAGIPFAWDPYPPDEMPAFRVGYGAVDRPFALLVPQGRLHEARAVLGSAGYLQATTPPTSEFFGSRSWDVPPEARGHVTVARQEPLSSPLVERAMVVLRIVLALAMLGLVLSSLLSR